MRRRREPGRAASDLELFALSSASEAGAHDANTTARGPVPRLEDSIPGASPASAVRIATLTQSAKDVLEGAFLPLWVRGEVSDFKAHRNGHWYFCLRDSQAQLRCVVWAREQRRIPAPPDDGMQVLALGQLSVYPARGEMQFSIRAMEAEGDGLWRKALDEARARLTADGLLAPDRKRPLPRCPQRIAVVTSPDGAAIRDIIAVVRRRYHAVEITVVPAKVQGDGAPEELCAAIRRVGDWGGAELLIIGRGGGAREDLWAFNDERVARALAAAPIPTISAVGHETDITLCDLVADWRAPTPSAAAEAAVPAREEMRKALGAAADALRSSTIRQLQRSGESVRRAAAGLRSASQRSVQARRLALEGMAGRLQALSPLSTLERGYAVARAQDGRTLSRAAHFTVGEHFELRLHDGVIAASVGAVLPLALQDQASGVSHGSGQHGDHGAGLPDDDSGPGDRQ